MELKYLCQSLAALSTSPSLPQAPCCSACKSLSVFFLTTSLTYLSKALTLPKSFLLFLRCTDVTRISSCIKDLIKGPQLRTTSPQKLYNGSSFYSKVLSYFPIEKFLTSNPQSKIPFVQALNIDHFNVISTTNSRISTISLCSFFCFNGR